MVLVMPRRTVSHDLKACIPVLFRKGYSMEEICDLLSIKKTLVYTSLSYYQVYSVSYNPHAHQKAGRPRLLQSVDIRFIQALLDRRQTVYITELQEELYQARKVHVSIPTLLRTLKHLNFSHKVVLHRAIECDNLRCSVFMNKIADEVPNPNMLMFVDEAAWNRRTSQQKFGWSWRGWRCIRRQFFVRGQRYSILPILTIDGIITYDIIPGSITAERFLQFLWELVVRSIVSCIPSCKLKLFLTDTID